MTKTAREQRLDDAFQVFVMKLSEQRQGWVPRWTPDLRASMWSHFARECATRVVAARVPAIFKNMDLECLSSRLPPKYLRLAKKLLEMLETPRLLAVGGARGTGKTALASGLVNKFCEVGQSALYTTAHEFFDGLTSTDWGEKEQYRKRHNDPELLVLDEVQVRDVGREWQNNELTTLIDVRHREGKSTLLLSNLPSVELKSNLGDSIWRRLIETGGQPIDTDWPRIHEWAESLRQKDRAVADGK